jgi:hypothetical protein
LSYCGIDVRHQQAMVRPSISHTIVQQQSRELAQMAATSGSSAHRAPPARSHSAKERFLQRLLDPIDLLVEGIYSVLIVLTFTLAVRAADSNRMLAQNFADDFVLQLFWAALGCAVAWGLIDGVMYILTCVFERGQERRLFRAIRNLNSEEAGIETLADELDDNLGSLATEEERRTIYATLYARLRQAPPPPVGLERADFAGALGIILVAVGTALPVVLPLLLFTNDPSTAVRVSNLAAFGMLFIMGYRWAVYAGGKPLRFGLLLMTIGVVMVLVAIPLGG